jgi:two-component system, NarL family, invasion response regulator UvrY
VAVGRQFLSPDIAHALALSMLAGRSAAEIAKTLDLSGKTISHYHTAIKQKLGVSTDVELVRIALRYNLLKE